MKKLAILIIMVTIFAGAACNKISETNKSSSSKVTVNVQEAQNKEIDFELTSLKGESIKLSDYLGKVVVLNFFATWCPPCKAEIPGFLSVMKEMKNNSSVKFIFVDSGEDKSTVSNFIKSKGYDSMNPLLDTDGSISGKYNITGIPTTYIIDKSGNIAVHHIGYMEEAALKSSINDVLSK